MEYGRLPLNPHPAMFLHYKTGAMRNRNKLDDENLSGKNIQSLQLWRKVIRYLVSKIIVAYIAAHKHKCQVCMV
ncbi:hypothetical protein HanRHA438_Chr15g0734991 [Helianthus annuus]|nr:hypothetical protein HanRHA438_Chr15g0734991 [Helianthus annuus]